MTDTNQPEDLTTKINHETAKIPWSELQRFFAAGKAVYVAKELDLISVAKDFANDNSQKIQQLMEQGQVKLVDDETASQWVEEDALTWAVVISPWVLVQRA